nr:hypothetical protein [Saprospiraceae bacterium]
MKRIKSLKDLKVAKLEARLAAKQSFQEMEGSGSNIKANFDGVTSVVQGIARIANMGGRKRSGIKDHDSVMDLGISVASQFAYGKVKWRAVVIPLAIWLIKSGYIHELSQTKKSDIYGLMLKGVRNLRKSLKKKN